jgi:hypothetical protein
MKENGTTDHKETIKAIGSLILLFLHLFQKNFANLFKVRLYSFIPVDPILLETGYVTKFLIYQNREVEQNE